MRSAQPAKPAVVDSPCSGADDSPGVDASARASGNCESGTRCRGMSRRASRIRQTGNTITISRAGVDQMVDRRSITPVVLSRKWPGDAMRRGALAESPNCQTDWAAHTVARRNGKSTGMPFSSAAALK